MKNMKNKNLIDFGKFKELLESGYPMGTENDPNAPWNQVDPETSVNYNPKDVSKSGISFSLIESDFKEFVLFSDSKNPKNLYVGYLESMEDLDEYRPYSTEYLGKDEDGDPDYEIHYEEIDGEGLEAYAKSLLPREIGEGLDAWESGDFPLVKLDEELADYLKDDFIKFSNMDNKYISQYKKVYQKMASVIDLAFTDNN